MTIAEQTKKIVAALTAWVAEHKGFVKLAGDEADLFTVLGAQPGAVRVGVMFDEETPIEGNESGYVKRKFIIAFSRGNGFFLDEGQALAGDAGDDTPLFLLAEQGREVVRALRFDLLDSGSADVIPEYLGLRRVQYDGHVVGAYAVEITIDSKIPQQNFAPSDENL